MNILIYTSTSPYGTERFGGAETSLRLIAEKLSQNGNNVYFLSKSEQKILPIISKKVINGVQVITLYDFLPKRIKRFKLNETVKQIHYYIIRAILTLYKIDLVHTYYELESCLFFLELREKTTLNFAFVMRMAGMHWHERVKKNPELLKHYQYVFENADAINFISDGLLQLFNAALIQLYLKIRLKSYFIFDIGVDVSLLSKYQYKFKDRDTLKLVMATRFSDYQKRQDILIDAMNLLKENVSIHLTLIGDGVTRKALQKKIIDSGLEHAITIIPFMEQKALWQLFSDADVLCHACDYEGLSKIVIESMAMGLPVLASDVKAVNTYIVDQKNGYLAENQPHAWAEKIKFIYKNRNDLKKISENATNFINEQYNADRNIILYIEELKKLRIDR